MAKMAKSPHLSATGRPFSLFSQYDLYDYYTEGYRSQRLPKFPALEELRHPHTRRQLLMNMSEDSHTTSSFLWTVRQMASQSKWRIIGEQNDPRVEFLDGVFFRDMDQDWDDVLSSALTMLIHGWSILEIIHKIRVGPEERSPRHRSIYKDKNVGIRMLGFRPQISIWNWAFDSEGTLTSVTQQIDGVSTEISAKNLLFFRTTGTSPDGQSILRGAYSAFFRGQVLEYLEAIGIERDLAGLPSIQLLPDQNAPNVFDPDDDKMVRLRQELEFIASNIRRDAQEGFVMPPWAEIRLVTSGGGTRSLNIKDALNRYDLRLLQALLADFLQLGTASRTGSYGLGSSRQSMFMLALDGFLSRIAKKINLQAIPPLLAMNGMPVENHPQIHVDPLEPKNLGILGAFFQQMSQAGLFVRGTPELAETLSAMTGLKIEFIPPEEATKALNPVAQQQRQQSPQESD